MERLPKAPPISLTWALKWEIEPEITKQLVLNGRIAPNKFVKSNLCSSSNTAPSTQQLALAHKERVGPIVL